MQKLMCGLIYFYLGGFEECPTVAHQDKHTQPFLEIALLVNNLETSIQLKVVDFINSNNL